MKNKKKHIIIAVFVSVAVIIGGFIAYVVGYEIYCSLFHDASDHDERIASGFYSCEENNKAVPGDAVCYSEYYYEADVADEIKEKYKLVNEENIDEAKKYMKRFESKFLFDSDKGKKDFMKNLNEGDYYHLKSGCSNDINENHFKLYFYDKETHTIYCMWRCQ